MDPLWIIGLVVVAVLLVTVGGCISNDWSFDATVAAILIVLVAFSFVLFLGQHAGVVRSSCPLVSSGHNGLYTNEPYTTVGKYKVKDTWYFHAEDTSGWARCVQSKDEPPAKFFLKGGILKPL